MTYIVAGNCQKKCEEIKLEERTAKKTAVSLTSSMGNAASKRTNGDGFADQGRNKENRR